MPIHRIDEAHLDALGAVRIPDPTTAGDFCRRFNSQKLLMQGINRSRQLVWKQQPQGILKQATIEADGTMVESRGQKKEGISTNYKGQWGYHPLVVSLAETQEVLYLANRQGNRPSHEGSAFYFDLAIEQCRKAGFEKITLRGHTDFVLTENFDRWDDEGIEFVFGIDAMPNLVELADSLENTQWTALRRSRSALQNRAHDAPTTRKRLSRPRATETKSWEASRMRSLIISQESVHEYTVW